MQELQARWCALLVVLVAITLQPVPLVVYPVQLVITPRCKVAQKQLKSAPCERCYAFINASFLEVGSISCGACGAGYFAASTGTVQCTVCPTGKYSAISSATACSSCSAGLYANTQVFSEGYTRFYEFPVIF
jgi:rubredoxin